MLQRDCKLQCTNLEEETLLTVMLDDVVVHHCHYSGHIFGPAHKRCNSRIQQEKRRGCNVYAHNATFDNQFILKTIDISLLTRPYCGPPEISVLGANMENIKAITIGVNKYLDSFKFYENSLAALCKIKTKEEKTMVNDMLREYFYQQAAHNYNHQMSRTFVSMLRRQQDDLLELVNDKGYYPYDYIKDKDVLAETSFPPLEGFNNKLSGEKADQKRYDQAKHINEVLNCKNLDEYTELYNVMDVINTCVIFELRSQQLKDYLHIDVRNFTSISVYSSAAAKFKTHSIIQTMCNKNIMEAIEAATHGGYSKEKAVSTKNKKASYVTKDGVKHRAMITIEAIDENNQYGHKMTLKLC